MKVPSYFRDFLAGIRLTESQIDDLKTGHETLRQRLLEDEELSSVIISTFLQGSYKRSTAVRPKDDSRADVDVIVVTNLSRDKYSPNEALQIFYDFLEEHYPGKYRIQGRSIGVSLSYVDLDIVVVSAPSECDKGVLRSLSDLSEYAVEDMISISQNENYTPKSIYDAVSEIPKWKMEPLWIPDREAATWTKTHPLEQIRWTLEKNKACNTHYINVVKALKWWKKDSYPDMEHLKSYPLEHLIGQSCKDGIESVAEGVTLTLEFIVDHHNKKPFLADHGVPEHDVLKRVEFDQYDEFYEKVCVAAEIARDALDEADFSKSVSLWRNLFGKKFPLAPNGDDTNKSSMSFTPRTSESEDIPEGRFA